MLKLVANAWGQGAEDGRSGRLADDTTTRSGVKTRPRPIHVGFSSYLEKVFSSRMTTSRKSER